tara:strand:- start:874 stop:1170 length:297 start_codon:yes stop_codon:yes gene_type:complete
MIYCFDIDGTICTQEIDYSDAKPYPERILRINELYDDGHKIIFLTARGFKTGIDWKEITTNQLNKWGVKYHNLHFGKPNADFYIDDKGRDIFNWFTKN